MSASKVQFSFKIITHEIVSEYLTVHGSAVRSVRFVGGVKDHEMVLVALCCTLLMYLYLKRTALTSAFKDILLMNPNLQEIYCEDLTCAVTNILAGISLHKLKAMYSQGVKSVQGYPWAADAYSDSLHTVAWDNCYFRGEALVALFKNCPQLRSFSAKQRNWTQRTIRIL